MVKKKNIQEVAIAEPVVIENVGILSNLHDRLEEVKSFEGVIGYILRDPTSAAIDLKDPSKIVEYAILSSTATETAAQISDLLDLGEANNIVIQGKNMKVLCLTVNEDKVSVFMEKDVDSEKIIRRLTT